MSDSVSLLLFPVNQFIDFVLRFTFCEKFAKIRIAQESRNLRQGLQVRPSAIFGSDEKKKDVDKLSIQGLEINPLSTDPKNRGKFFHAIGFAVGNRNPLANSRGSQTFALNKRIEDIFFVADFLHLGQN